MLLVWGHLSSSSGHSQYCTYFITRLELRKVRPFKLNNWFLVPVRRPFLAGHMPYAHAQTDLFHCRCLEDLIVKLIVYGFAILVCQCHAKIYISLVAAWHHGSSGLEHHLGRWIIDLTTRIRERSRWYWWSWRRAFMDTWHRPLWLTACEQGGIARKWDFQQIRHWLLMMH